MTNSSDCSDQHITEILPNVPHHIAELLGQIRSDMPDLFKRANDISSYNDINYGRMGCLVASATLLIFDCDESRRESLKQVFSMILDDTLFLRGKLTWLPPYFSEPSEAFSGNMGILLGFFILKKYFTSDSAISLLAGCICIEHELSSIQSAKTRKFISKLLCSESNDISISDILRLTKYYNRTKDKVVLEAIILGSFIGGHFLNPLVQGFARNAFHREPLFLVILYICSSRESYRQNMLFNECFDAVGPIMRRNLKSIYEFCGSEFMSELVQDYHLRSELKPEIWINAASSSFSKKTLLFKCIVRRERLLTESFDHLWVSPQHVSRHISGEVLRSLYCMRMSKLFEISFTINRGRIRYFFSSFWIGIFSVSNFTGLNVDKKIRSFAKSHRSAKFTVLLAKRYEKAVTWQGRSFSCNQEVDFLYFFLSSNNTVNSYKAKFGCRSLEDHRIVGLIFWLLEAGLFSFTRT